MSQEILSVKDLQTYFFTRGGVVKAVDGVSFNLKEGETLGIVGESGSGKSVTMMSLMGLIASPPGKIVGGEAHFMGEDLLQMNAESKRRIRGKDIAMIFQDPMTSLNPYLKISTQLTEVLAVHTDMSKKAMRDRAIEVLQLVGIPSPEKRIDQYPHEFSGGMRQRVMIAMALIAEPKLLIADEPTTALDVTVQAQILELLSDIQLKTKMSMILITHDLGVVAGLSDRIVVMYAGKLVERGDADQIFYKHQHPYTQGLLKSIPRIDSDGGELFSIAGLPPDPSRLPPGCPFAPRCERAHAECRQDKPVPVQDFGSGHVSRCYLEAL